MRYATARHFKLALLPAPCTVARPDWCHLSSGDRLTLLTDVTWPRRDGSQLYDACAAAAVRRHPDRSP